MHSLLGDRVWTKVGKVVSNDRVEGISVGAKTDGGISVEDIGDWVIGDGDSPDGVEGDSGAPVEVDREQEML